MMYRVFIVEDHPDMREMLGAFLDTEPDLQVCGAASNGRDALEQIDPDACDIVLIDVAMPVMNGIELVRRLNEQGVDLPCLMLSGHAEAMYIQGALEAGARGYVMKGDPDTILEAIRCVLRGDRYLSKEVRQTIQES